MQASTDPPTFDLSSRYKYPVAANPFPEKAYNAISWQPPTIAFNVYKSIGRTMPCFKAGVSSIPYYINNLESELFLYAIVFSTGMNLFDEF